MPTREEVQDRSGAHRLRGETNKTSDWFCTFNIEYDAGTLGETPIGVDIGERHILVVTAYGEDESMLISGGEARYVQHKYLPYASRFQRRVRFAHATVWVTKSSVE